MKILEINKFNYVQGGSDRHFQDLTRLLKVRGNEVAVFSMDSSQNEFSPWKKYFVSYVGFGKADSLWQKIKGIGRMFYSFEAKRNMRKLLADFQPDIAHIHNIYHQISPSILSEIKKRKIPIVMTVHDYKLICPNYLLQCNGQSWENLDKNKYLNFIKQKCFKQSYLKSLLVVLEFSWHKFLNIYDKNIDLYLAPSEFTKNKLIANGIDGNKIRVLPHFVTEENHNEIAKLANVEKYVIYFGQISTEKGVDKLIAMFKNFPEIKLYLAGSVYENFIIPELDNVKYVGFLEQQELTRYIKNSLFVISPSRLPETFGLVALEAIKNGKPFVGFDAGAYGEIVENNRSGYICKNEEEMMEGIKQLAADDGLRILFSRRALERAKNFDSKQYYERIMGIFHELVVGK
ncbi:MAG: group 1 glycosyl transferase [Candidatus Moranbacteria bacterium GW2011_GWA2_39_41]|nr:MAG: group 1 glycosyl transferase [Candidatus Moranbacteria bacterium GW2011_GWA2_39_41]